MNRSKLLILTTIVIVINIITLTPKPMLFKNGKSDYVIILCDNASTSEQTAATELQAYLQQIGGVVLPIKKQSELPNSKKHIFVGFNNEYAAKYDIDRPKNDYEGYTYQTVGKNIWIYGGEQRGTMYGVYSFLENELGVRWYTPDYTKIPTLKEWKIRQIHHSEEPFINYRYVLYANIEHHSDWMAHNKCNTVSKAQENERGGLSAFWGYHTFGEFIPTKEYFAKHPEYFSLRDGKRTPHSQLCLSNPNVLQICIEKIKQAIADNPLYWAYSLAQNDNQLPCQCDKCRALEEQYGGHSGLMIWFVNQVADAIKPLYPDKYIGTFAYQYTRQAPTGIIPRDNVVIRLCSLEGCFAHPLAECDHNHSFITDIENWSKIAPNLFVWDYVVNFRQFVAPFPNFGVLAENIKTFKKYNAIGVMEQGQYLSSGGEFAEMRYWVLSKLLWNPHLDTRALVAQFIEDFYGEAAPYIQQYFDLCHSLIKDDSVMDIYSDETNPLYTNNFIAETKAILEQAKQAVASASEEIRFRTDLACLQIDYLRIMRTPQETKEDGTLDRLFAFVQKHNIRLTEFASNDEFLYIYNQLASGQTTIEEVIEIITKRWVENGG